jgi:putative transcriptional regulator
VHWRGRRRARHPHQGKNVGAQAFAFAGSPPYRVRMPEPKAPRRKTRSAATAQDGPSRDFLVGKLLIAMPNMSDPRFARSVVLMITHDEDHAMGVVINKRVADLELGDLLEQLKIDPREGVGGEPVHYGGPLQTDRGVVIHTLEYRTAQTIELCGAIGVTATKEILNVIGGRAGGMAPHHYLLAIGHAGWGPGQLESEIAVNAWAHCDLDAALIFAGDREDVWSAALAKLGVTAARLSPEWASARRDDALLN